MTMGRALACYLLLYYNLPIYHLPTLTPNTKMIHTGGKTFNIHCLLTAAIALCIYLLAEGVEDGEGVVTVTNGPYGLLHHFKFLFIQRFVQEH